MAVYAAIPIALLAALLWYRSHPLRLSLREPPRRYEEERYYGDYNDYYEHED